MSVGRDQHGCFPGCYVHGCEATRCSLFKPLSTATKRKAEPRDGWMPDGSYRTQFEAGLLERIDSLVTALGRRRR